MGRASEVGAGIERNVLGRGTGQRGRNQGTESGQGRAIAKDLDPGIGGTALDQGIEEGRGQETGAIVEGRDRGLGTGEGRGRGGGRGPSREIGTGGGAGAESTWEQCVCENWDIIQCKWQTPCQFFSGLK